MSENKNEIKVIVLGGTKVGKSSISLRFTKNEFLPYPIVAPGTSTLTKSMSLASSSNPNNNVNINIKIWDTSGNRTMLPIYYKRADAAILVFDVTNQDSFNNVQTWVNELQNNGPNNMSITICGNKNDIDARVVDSTVARIYTEQFGGYYIETSAKCNVNVQQLFIDTVRRTNAFKKVRPMDLPAPRMISSKINNRSIVSANKKPISSKKQLNPSSKYPSSSLQQTKKRKFNHEDSEITITTKKCSYCLNTNAAVIVGGITQKPLCLLHYHTTRSIRADKVKQVGNGNFLQQQLPDMQELFAEAFVELQKDIADENARNFINGTSKKGSKDLLGSLLGSKKKVVTQSTDLLGIMLGNPVPKSNKKKWF